jgi:hypothetical protein
MSMIWEPSRKTLLVLRTGNKVGDRSDIVFSVIVFRRLRVFKLRFFLAFFSVPDGFFLNFQRWHGVWRTRSFLLIITRWFYPLRLSSLRLGAFFMHLSPFEPQLLLNCPKWGR